MTDFERAYRVFEKYKLHKKLKMTGDTIEMDHGPFHCEYDMATRRFISATKDGIAFDAEVNGEYHHETTHQDFMLQLDLYCKFARGE